MLRVNVIGPGRVGQTLMRLLGGLSDVEIGDVAARRDGSAKAATAAVGAGHAVLSINEMRPADLWLLTVPDDKITGLATALACLPLAPAMAVHCSGFLGSDACAPLRDEGWHTASCHPVLSFADPELAARQFPGTFCAIEGDAPAASAITGLITRLGGCPFPVDPDRKAVYHAAAVVSNNFTTVLQGLAQDLWQDAGVDAETAMALGNTLLQGTADNIARLGPATALTGPAARGDTRVMEEQEAALAARAPEAAELYRLLSRLARRLKETGSILGPS